MSPSAARLASLALRALPRKRLSRAMGRVAELVGPHVAVERAIATFVRAYGVDLSEARVPPGGFSSFDAFFTRRLQEGARPLDPDPAAVLSPADGRLEDLGAVREGGEILVKGKPYAVAELLGDEALVGRFEGGSYFIVYLSPRDYHRVHAPVSGVVEQVGYVAGTLFPVNAIGTEHIPGLFARNERIVTLQRSARHGQVATVMVGAIGVGRIELSFDSVRTNVGDVPGPRHLGERGPVLARGDELGAFHLGSTAIVFLPSGYDLHFEVPPGAPVRVGQAIARGSL